MEIKLTKYIWTTSGKDLHSLLVEIKEMVIGSKNPCKKTPRPNCEHIPFVNVKTCVLEDLEFSNFTLMKVRVS